MDKKVTITIDALGNPKVEAHNFQGQSCAAATGGLEKMLSGGGGVTTEFKPEWTQEDSTAQQQVTQSW